MNEQQSDFEWLQQFARAGNQGAFRDIVGRHLNLVLATALHKTGDAGGAEEISQNVFNILARKAWQFAPDDSLPAWLYKTTLLESKQWLRGEIRRRRREQTAAELGTTMKTSNEQPAINALIPLLDEALLSLREKDRTALLLRFYEKQPLSTLGTMLGVNEDAAQKRVQAALERLSQFFQRRGYKTATVTAATTALQQTATSVSAATVSTVASTALQFAPPVQVGLGVWLTRLMTITKVQTAAVCIVLTAAPLVWKWEQIRTTASAATALQSKLSVLQTEQTDASGELERLRSESAQLEQRQSEARQNQALAEEAGQKLATLKKQSRGLLVADDYRWPDDLPFVRVPKSLVAAIGISGGPNSPGRLAFKINEFLDLSASERAATAQVFSNYTGEIDRLMADNLYETNQSTLMSLPRGAESKVFVLLPLGEKIRAALGNLCTNLETTLGSERWAMVNSDASELTDSEQVRLLGYTRSDWDKRQEIMVNIFQAPPYGLTIEWKASDGTGGERWPLHIFTSENPSFPFIFPQGPPMLIGRVKQYCFDEAKARFPEQTSK